MLGTKTIKLLAGDVSQSSPLPPSLCLSIHPSPSPSRVPMPGRDGPLLHTPVPMPGRHLPLPNTRVRLHDSNMRFTPTSQTVAFGSIPMPEPAWSPARPVFPPPSSHSSVRFRSRLQLLLGVGIAIVNWETPSSQGAVAGTAGRAEKEPSLINDADTQAAPYSS